MRHNLNKNSGQQKRNCQSSRISNTETTLFIKKTKTEKMLAPIVLTAMDQEVNLYIYE